MKELKIMLPEEVLEKYRYEAKVFGMTPNAVIRLRLCEQVLGFDLDMSRKSYLIQFDKWRDIEAYIKVKGFISISEFATKAAENLMKRNALTEAQKAEADRLLKK
ncbi:MAG: hypothetical protein LBK62_00515 [Treponema sp.]|nr:hypothetical protein [Treponema sp.]